MASMYREFQHVESVHIYTPIMSARQYLRLAVGDDIHGLGYEEKDGHLNLNWRTVMTLDTHVARIPELVDLATIMKNLVALHLSSILPSSPAWDQRQGRTPDQEFFFWTTTLSDRIARSWSSSASSSSAFACLRLLSLRNQHELSTAGLRCLLLSFPELHIVYVTNCPALGLEEKMKEARGVEVEVEKGWVIFPYISGGGANTLMQLYETDKTVHGGWQHEEAVLSFELGEGEPPLAHSSFVLQKKSSIQQQQQQSLPPPPPPSKQGRAIKRRRVGHGAKDLTDVLAEFQ